jgi:hypothetical protein
MGFKFGSRTVGHDGTTSDINTAVASMGDSYVVFSHISKTNAQGHPILLSATSRCGVCGTSDQHSGKPGTVLRQFTCRSCNTTCIANNGVPFRFISPN